MSCSLEKVTFYSVVRFGRIKVHWSAQSQRRLLVMSRSPFEAAMAGSPSAMASEAVTSFADTSVSEASEEASEGSSSLSLSEEEPRCLLN